MTLLQAVTGFAVIAGLLTIVPGLDTALVLRSALGSGRSTASWTTLGITAGLLVWGAAAALGVSTLLAASQLAYDVVRLCGAVYLICLGVRMLVRSLRRGGPLAVASAGPARTGRLRAWTTGLTTNLLNPKIGIFYVATLPQFLVPDEPPAAMGVLLASVHALITLLWLGLLSLGAGAAAGWLRRPLFSRLLDGITGGVLIGLGVRTALEQG